MLQLVDDILYLVNDTAIVVGPGAPLVTVDGTQLAVLVGPLVPDAHAVFLQILHVGIAVEEPQQLVDDRLQVQFLRRQQRKTVLHVVTTLCAKNAQGAGTCTVTLLGTLAEDTVKYV